MKPGRRTTRERERETESVRERYTEEEGAREGLDGISVLNISSHQPGNNADLNNLDSEGSHGVLSLS